MSVGTLASQTRNWPWREANEGRDKGDDDDDDDDADVDGPVLAVAALGADIGGTGVVHGALATVTIVDRSAVGVIASKACMSATAATSSPVASSIATYIADVDAEAAEVVDVDVGGAAASLFLAATGAAVLMLVLLLLVLELTLTTLTPAACVCATSPDDAPAAPAAIAAAPLVLAPSAPIAVTSTGPLPPGASTHGDDDDATAAAAWSRLPSVAGTGSTSFPITSAILRATPP